MRCTSSTKTIKHAEAKVTALRAGGPELNIATTAPEREEVWDASTRGRTLHQAVSGRPFRGIVGWCRSEGARDLCVLVPIAWCAAPVECLVEIWACLRVCGWIEVGGVRDWIHIQCPRLVLVTRRSGHGWVSPVQSARALRHGSCHGYARGVCAVCLRCACESVLCERSLRLCALRRLGPRVRPLGCRGYRGVRF